MLNRVRIAAAAVGVFAVGAVAVLAGFMPSLPAEATSLNGYTYTLLLCQEYGQAPAWYKVRDQGNHGWRQRDSGWMLVLTRGGAATYLADDSGAYVTELNSDPAVYMRFIVADGNGNPRRADWDSGSYNWDTQGEYVKVGPGWGDDDFLRVTTWEGPAPQRYRYSVTSGGSVRWANMRWCRAGS